MSGEDSGTTPGNQQSMEQNNINDRVAENEANAESSFSVGESSNDTAFDSFPKKLNEEKQGRHIPGHPLFTPGRSELTITMSRAAELVEKYAGTGTAIGDHKERIDFGEIIGYYVDQNTGQMMLTTIGIIHYSNTGVHIVPARPQGGIV